MLIKVASCVALLFAVVASTLCAEASKSEDGTYPYNSFLIPCAVEAVKLCVSSCLLAFAFFRGGEVTISFSLRKFMFYLLPAFSYFVSNNCMFYVIEELGPATFQITNNLKVFATGILMRLFLGTRLSWLRWKALILLVLGSVVTQLPSDDSVEGRNSIKGYLFVCLHCFASGAGGVLTEKLLKGNTPGAPADHIHWQNMQLYFFGLAFGLIGSWYATEESSWPNLFAGFNLWACLTVGTLTTVGLLVSFILKYLDNFAKCFVTGVSIIFVVMIDAALQGRSLQVKVIVGIVLTCMALEQYHLPQVRESKEHIERK